MKGLKWASVFVLIILLSGCWDSVELDESIMVVGVGISKQDDEYQIIFEAITPSEINPDEMTVEGESTLLQTKGSTLFDAAREIIRIAKRRLFFTHAEVWIIQSDLASEEDMLLFLDVLRREQMLRLNSFLFISNDEPAEIFTSDFTFSNILSEELISGIEFNEYVSDYPAVRARDFFKRLLSPLRTGYLPTIQTTKQNEKVLSQLSGSAIFKKGKMVGVLNPSESSGLKWLNNEVHGGNITVKVGDSAASFKLINGNMGLETQLQGDKLTVDIDIKAEGSLADQIIQVNSLDEWIDKFKDKVNQSIKADIHKALQKLQKEYKTDATLIGLETYRKQPDQFNQVQDKWDDVFAEATIHIHVDTVINNKGLIDSPGYQFPEQKQRNPHQKK